MSGVRGGRVTRSRKRGRGQTSQKDVKDEEKWLEGIREADFNMRELMSRNQQREASLFTGGQTSRIRLQKKRKRSDSWETTHDLIANENRENINSEQLVHDDKTGNSWGSGCKSWECWEQQKITFVDKVRYALGMCNSSEFNENFQQESTTEDSYETFLEDIRNTARSCSEETERINPVDDKDKFNMSVDFKEDESGSDKDMY